MLLSILVLSSVMLFPFRRYWSRPAPMMSVEEIMFQLVFVAPQAAIAGAFAVLRTVFEGSPLWSPATPRHGHPLLAPEQNLHLLGDSYRTDSDFRFKDHGDRSVGRVQVDTRPAVRPVPIPKSCRPPC